MLGVYQFPPFAVAAVTCWPNILPRQRESEELPLLSPLSTVDGSTVERPMAFAAAWGFREAVAVVGLFLSTERGTSSIAAARLWAAGGRLKEGWGGGWRKEIRA